jgi:hypothetical protein
MKFVLPVLRFFYALIALVFGLAAVSLLALAGIGLLEALSFDRAPPITSRPAAVIESIGLVTVSLMALEMAQTVLEEEVMRRAHVSAPTRVRRYLSRFLVVVVVALSIESLVGVVEVLHRNPDDLPRAASVAVAAAAVLIAWGVFIRLNRSAEELEPEGIEEAQQEDQKVQDDDAAHMKGARKGAKRHDITKPD